LAAVVDQIQRVLDMLSRPYQVLQVPLTRHEHAFGFRAWLTASELPQLAA
jgi:sulfopyruvate decarboxylase TPP-binding subunit